MEEWSEGSNVDSEVDSIIDSDEDD
ncbi:unnamed protein product, partial [Brachionus calyciflorus]